MKPFGSIARGDFRPAVLAAAASLVFFSAAVTARAAPNAPPARLLNEASVTTRLVFDPPKTVALTLALGTILMPDRDGYQPMVVTEIRIEKPDGYANELQYDAKTRSYTVMLQAGKKKTIIASGFCLVDIAKAPEEGVIYRMSGKRIPFETLSRLASNKNEDRDFQELLWQEVQRQLQQER
jgi:hypothetical protein